MNSSAADQENRADHTKLNDEPTNPDPCASEEYREARRLGPLHELAILTRYLTDARERHEGTVECLVLKNLLDYFVRQGERMRAYDTAYELAAHSDCDPVILYYVAVELYARCTDPSAALQILEPAIARLRAIPGPHYDYPWLVLCTRLELAARVAIDPHAEEVSRILAELSWMLSGAAVYDEFFIPAITTASEAGVLTSDHRILIEMAWSDLIRRQHFHGADVRSDLERIEAVLAAIPSGEDD